MFKSTVNYIFLSFILYILLQSHSMMYANWCCNTLYLLFLFFCTLILNVFHSVFLLFFVVVFSRFSIHLLCFINFFYCLALELFKVPLYCVCVCVIHMHLLFLSIVLFFYCFQRYLLIYLFSAWKMKWSDVRWVFFLPFITSLLLQPLVLYCFTNIYFSILTSNGSF